MPALPFENLPASPESIFQREYESGQRQIQQQFELQWNEINRRARSFRSPEQHKQALDELHAKGQQTILRFNQEMQQRSNQLRRIDQLAEQGAIQNPDEVKWRMVLGPEAERGMFPTPARPKDPRTEYHANLRLRNELMRDVASYQLDSKGRLYGVDPDTGKIDKKMPASETEFQGWMQSISALESAKMYKQEQIMPSLTTADIASTRLQEILLEQQEKSWRKKFEKTMWGIMKWMPGYPMAIARGREAIKAPETPGTFSDKVAGTMGRPIAEPTVREPTEKITRKQLLSEYRRLGGGQTAEGRAFADRYLR